jgi:hypothetical protein
LHTKERFHKVISKGLGVSLPSTAQENADPAAADEVYRAATTWLIGQTRDVKKFPLVFKENVAFGFHRNALGVRPYGVLVSTLCIAWILFHAKVLSVSGPFVAPDRMISLGPEESVATIVAAAILGVWLLFFNEAALQRAGFSYAERLLQSCDNIKPVSPVRRSATKRVKGKKP